MHLVQLDQDNLVLSVVPIAQAPFLQLLNALCLIAVNPPQLGQLFDSVTSSFVAPPRRRWITKLAFDNRFTMDEAVSLKLAQNLPARLAEENDVAYNARCAMPAQLQVLQGRLNMATYIDLDRADTQAAVQALEAMGLLGTGRAGEILEGLISTHEYHPEA